MSARRLPWLLAALAATAAWAALDGGTHEAATPAHFAAEPLPAIRTLLARMPSSATSDPFSLPAPLPPAAASAIATAPVLPMAPAWHCIGKQRAEGIEGDGWSVFLARGTKTRVVRVGDTLDDSYRVAAITPPTLTLLHLKSRTRHTIDIGATRE